MGRKHDQEHTGHAAVAEPEHTRSWNADQGSAFPNQPAGQEEALRPMRMMPYMHEKGGFTEECKGCRFKQTGLLCARSSHEGEHSL